MVQPEHAREGGIYNARRSLSHTVRRSIKVIAKVHRSDGSNGHSQHLPSFSRLFHENTGQDVARDAPCRDPVAGLLPYLATRVPLNPSEIAHRSPFRSPIRPSTRPLPELLSPCGPHPFLVFSSKMRLIFRPHFLPLPPRVTTRGGHGQIPSAHPPSHVCPILVSLPSTSPPPRNHVEVNLRTALREADTGGPHPSPADDPTVVLPLPALLFRPGVVLFIILVMENPDRASPFSSHRDHDRRDGIQIPYD